MATIDDFGDTAEPLNQPLLGGPSGWAAAVRDAIVAVQDALTGKVSKAGDTLTGALSFGQGPGIRWPNADRMLYADETGDWLGVLNIAGGLATLRAKSPATADDVATKDYVDSHVRGGYVYVAANNSTGTYVAFSPPMGGNYAVVVTPSNPVNRFLSTSEHDTNGFRLWVTNSDGANPSPTEVHVYWIAVRI